MAEEGETSEIFVARKYGTPETKKVGEGKKEGSLAERTLDLLDSNLTDPEGKEVYQRIRDNRETDPDSSLFHLIQEELRDLDHKPQPEIESVLRRGRHILIREAKEHGIFDSMKGYLHEAQASNDYGRAMEVIKKMNVRNLEDEARGVRGWSHDFGGMLDEYKDVALLNMRIAELRASGLGDSTQAKGLERKIDLRGWGQPPQGLESMALGYLIQQERRIGREEARPGMPIPPGDADMQELMKRQIEANEKLADSLEAVDPRAERERWVDMEYQQEFYTRFDPRSEPRFYRKMETEEERRLFDDRWQLARAAFYKRATTAFPDKYRENQELERLGKEQMKRLYEMPGVRRMMEGYIKLIVDGRVQLSSGEELTFWETEDAAGFERIREGLREHLLGETELDDLAQKEADAVAWNLLWVGNLVESADSRYSYGGKSHFGLPGVMISLEHKYALHPQERFEVKSLLGHYWGGFW